MTIKQLNCTYLINEDRILFRFNTQERAEYRLWFTRRVALFILAATSHLLTKKLEQEHSPDAAKALNEFEKEAILEKTKNQDLGAQSYEPGLTFPLGFDPILVMDVTCALTNNGEKLAYIKTVSDEEIDDSLSIDFVLPGAATLNLRLSGNMMHGMCMLLDQLRQQAGWGEAALATKKDEQAEAISEVQNTQKISLH